MREKLLRFLAGLSAGLGTYIEIPVDFASSMKATIGDVFSDLTIPVVIVICLPIAFWFVAKVISVIRGGLTARGRRA